MEYLYRHRKEEDLKFISRVCNDILRVPYPDKIKSDDFAGIYLEGRNRSCCVEDLAAITSFKLHSKANYPVFCFLNNENFFEGSNPDWVSDARINIIKIPEMSHEEYSNFAIDELFFKIPNNIEKVLTLHADGFLIKSGWEQYVNESGADWLSPHWRHYASCQHDANGGWGSFYGFRPTPVGNGGFSFRKASKIRRVTENFSHLTTREAGRDDSRRPSEDLFFCYYGFNSRIMSAPSLSQCDLFAKDPLTPELYDGPDRPFGFHFFKDLSEPPFPPCHHD